MVPPLPLGCLPVRPVPSFNGTKTEPARTRLMARTPKTQDEHEEKAWTPDSIRLAIRKVRRRLTDLEGFEPTKVRSRQDPNIRVLEAAIKETLSDIFGPNSRSFRTYGAAATIDTASYNMNGTPLDE